MFWHFLKVVYSRACESRGVWIKVRKLKLTRTLHLGQESIIIQLNTERGGSYVVEKRLSEKITRPVKGHIF